MALANAFQSLIIPQINIQYFREKKRRFQNGDHIVDHGR